MIHLNSSCSSLKYPPKMSGLRLGNMTTVRAAPPETERNAGLSPDASHRKNPAVAGVTDRRTTVSLTDFSLCLFFFFFVFTEKIYKICVISWNYLVMQSFLGLLLTQALDILASVNEHGRSSRAHQQLIRRRACFIDQFVFYPYFLVRSSGRSLATDDADDAPEMLFECLPSPISLSVHLSNDSKKWIEPKCCPNGKKIVSPGNSMIQKVSFLLFR